jgi:DNA-binding response OmpR family regulator
MLPFIPRSIVSGVAAGVPGTGEHAARLSPRARVLVVEDNWLISSLVSEELQELGYLVIGPARSVAEAVAYASDVALDAALVDLSLGGILANDVIDILAERKVPFIFVTAHTPIPLEVHGTAPVLEKPFTTEALRRAVEAVVGRQ